MLAIERRQKIIELLQMEKRVLVSDLSKRFNVTEETIRRDLEKLESKGIVTRTYGGAILNQKIREDLPFVTRKDINVDIKQAIAKKVTSYINDYDSLFMDSSSTCFELFKLIKDNRHSTIITNSVKILSENPSSNLHVISTGGILRPNSLSLVGAISQSTIKSYNTDLAIISCQAIDISRGIMDSNEPDAEIKKIMVQQANKTFLLVDHTKFDTLAFVNFLNFQQVDYLVTDQKPSDDWLHYLHNKNVTVVY